MAKSVKTAKSVVTPKSGKAAKSVATPKPVAKAVVAEGGKNEEWATAQAQAMFGKDGVAWCITESLDGTKQYKAPRYRVGYKVAQKTGRFIEDGKYMAGVGASYSAAVAMAPGFVAAQKAKLAAKSAA